jgi:hypothetical protein
MTRSLATRTLMTHSRTAMLPRRSPVVVLSLVLSLVVGLAPATAQSVESIVDNMRAQYEQQFETVDTYIVETDLYTSYNRKASGQGSSYQTQTKMKGEGMTSFTSNTTVSSAYGLRFDRLKQHATYAGTEMIDGMECYLLQVDDPSKVDPEMGSETESMTYYIHTDRLVPARMVMESTSSTQNGTQPSSVTINLKNYTTTDGLTLPHRMEFHLDANISEQQRRQMKQAMQKMENMPEQQRKQMEKMMGNPMEMMKQIVSGVPITIDVQSVQVNTDIPEGVF